VIGKKRVLDVLNAIRTGLNDHRAPEHVWEMRLPGWRALGPVPVRGTKVRGRKLVKSSFGGICEHCGDGVGHCIQLLLERMSEMPVMQCKARAPSGAYLVECQIGSVPCGKENRAMRAVTRLIRARRSLNTIPRNERDAVYACQRLISRELVGLGHGWHKPVTW